MSERPQSQDQTRAKHHYVTQAYLENMRAIGETRLWVYERNSERVFRNIPANLASTRAYYTTVNKEGVEKDYFEKLLASEIEGPGIPVIRKLSSDTSQLSMEEIGYGATLIAMQELRVPFKREQLSTMMKTSADLHLKSAMSHPGIMESVFQELKEQGMIDSSLTAEGMRKIYDEGGFNIVTTTSGELWALSIMLRQLMNTYAAMKWTVLVAPTQIFVSSDTPVCRDYPETAGSPAGVVNPDLTIYFPLCPTRVLMLQHDHKKYRLFKYFMLAGRRREAEQLRHRTPSISCKYIQQIRSQEINKIIIERAMRWVYAPVEMPDIPRQFCGESRNVRVEIEKLDDSGLLRMTHRLS